ncbi:Rieske (2Fe-2S) protein [Botrimarina mediterranea]|uniref:3-phenylpropionate/cinnamic acid dioxygenase ferredoxin subunit n=1 Tax=Botrimarina mediterranea TaxID=2528022 RepID=A0A518KAS4_9BACT|nr:non-heme iron oxygenase ferredoxin subunit [Botrimarina mediterranea]QDV74893.1 3-phenylpropionate/cinnamic acid dioxygenase ferredoxin subunit [Botrimarina mediterranea]QDV79536.1 3-phenylpropionate/cinnamic acid dioxygenase ferredoxin subunit [Planctomycetes bacterium K2D]
MSEFIPVGPITDFADPSSTLVEVDDESVALIHAAGSFYALDDVCTHDGGPLSDGPLHEDENPPAIACPRHGAKFALTTGAALTMPATQPTRVHEVKVEDGQVLVKLTV